MHTPPRVSRCLDPRYASWAACWRASGPSAPTLRQTAVMPGCACFVRGYTRRQLDLSCSGHGFSLRRSNSAAQTKARRHAQEKQGRPRRCVGDLFPSHAVPSVSRCCAATMPPCMAPDSPVYLPTCQCASCVAFPGPMQPSFGTNTTIRLARRVQRTASLKLLLRQAQPSIHSGDLHSTAVRFRLIAAQTISHTR
jgi:hypothetical protein